MNNIILSGNVGKDSELTFLQNGTALLKFSMAVERGYQKDKQNKVSDWFNIVLFGKYGEAMANHIKKGTKVLVSGEMQITYDKDKQKTYTSVNADKLEMIKWANDGKGEKEDNSEDFSSVEDDDNIPF